MFFESPECKRMMEQDNQQLAAGKVNWERNILNVSKQLIRCYVNLARYEDTSDDFDSDPDNSSYKVKTDLQISNEVKQLETYLAEKNDNDEIGNDKSLKIHHLNELLKARRNLYVLIQNISDTEHNNAVETLANRIKEWKGHQLSKEEKERNDKIIQDNFLLAKAKFLSNITDPDESIRAVIKEAEDLEYIQPFPHQYPWEDVALSLLQFPDRVVFDYDQCPTCGQSRTRLYFHSPEATWAMMCGVAGYMTICPHCQIQTEFNQTMRN